MTLTFIAVAFGAMIVRAGNARQFGAYFHQFFFPYQGGMIPVNRRAIAGLLASFFLLCIEWPARNTEHPLAYYAEHVPRVGRMAVYGLLLFSVLVFMPSDGTPFIYYQF
jgi:hypothetical protein